VVDDEDFTRVGAGSSVVVTEDDLPQLNQVLETADDYLNSREMTSQRFLEYEGERQQGSVVELRYQVDIPEEHTICVEESENLGELFFDHKSEYRFFDNDVRHQVVSFQPTEVMFVDLFVGEEPSAYAVIGEQRPLIVQRLGYETDDFERADTLRGSDLFGYLEINLNESSDGVEVQEFDDPALYFRTS